jgi:hypothetical protein
MRLWSLHPKYLDSKGLVALWREALLAKAVLNGKTIGYKNHPQLIRFKIKKNPKALINTYLLHIYHESVSRGYKFNKNKIGSEFTQSKIKVTNGQIEYELDHLKSKLKIRDPSRYMELINLKEPEPNPLFMVVEGCIETWEII